MNRRTPKIKNFLRSSPSQISAPSINIWHINNFSVAPVTDAPGRVPDPPGRVPGRKCLFSLGSAHSTFDPWPPVGRPLATRSGDPPPPGSHRKILFYVYVHFPFLTHGSTPTPGFLTSRNETQTMVQAKLRPKLRPRQTLTLPGKRETQTMV